MTNNVSDALLWEVLRKNTAYVAGKARDGKCFTREPGNIPSLHAHKYSLFGNWHKYVGVVPDKSFPRREAAVVHLRDAQSTRTTKKAIKSGTVDDKVAEARAAARKVRPDLARAAAVKVSRLCAAKRHYDAKKAQEENASKAR